MIVPTEDAPRDQMRSGQLIHWDQLALSQPAVTARVDDGKNAVRARPMFAFAAAAWRSLEATSGRRSSSCDGRNVGTAGGTPVMEDVLREKADGGRPTRT